MSTQTICDICGRTMHDRKVHIDIVTEGTTRSLDICTARDGADIGCDQFIQSALRGMEANARAAAEERRVS